jgi:DNA-binding NarL/FixJ family response regulator
MMRRTAGGASGAGGTGPHPGRAGAREPATPGTSTGLTARERQVLELLAEGLTNRRIAKNLFITEKTVSVHVTHILEKLQVTNRSEAGAIARGPRQSPRLGWGNPGR